MVEPLSLSDELKKALATWDGPRLTRIRNDLWSHSLGDIEWRIALDKEQGWSRAQRRIRVGVAIPSVHRVLDGLGPLNEGVGTIGGSLLALAGRAEPRSDPALTLAARPPRFRWSRSVRTTWPVDRFREELPGLLDEFALPLWQRFGDLNSAAETLRSSGDELVGQGLLTRTNCDRIIAELTRSQADRPGEVRPGSQE